MQERTDAPSRREAPEEERHARPGSPGREGGGAGDPRAADRMEPSLRWPGGRGGPGEERGRNGGGWTFRMVCMRVTLRVGGSVAPTIRSSLPEDDA